MSQKGRRANLHLPFQLIPPGPRKAHEAHLLDERLHALEGAAVRRGYVVIDGHEGAVGAADAAAGAAEALKGLQGKGLRKVCSGS